jgi:hypothetical protein
VSDITDLDALVPPQATIKFGGKEVTVTPPKTADILKLGALGQKLQNIEGLDDATVDKLVDDLTVVVKHCIPELGDAQLNTPQLLKVMEILSKMAVPPDVAELDKRGITVGDPKAPQE